MLLGPETEADHGFATLRMSHTHDDWDVLAQDIGVLFGDAYTFPPPTAKDLHALPSAAGHLAWPGAGLSLPGTPDTSASSMWLGSSASSSDSPGTAPMKRSPSEGARAKRPRPAKVRPAPAVPAYSPPTLIPMAPRMLSAPPSTDALRAWLLERRALLQKTRDDVTKDMARLDDDEKAWAQLRVRLGERIEHARRAAPPPDAPSWYVSKQLRDMTALLEAGVLLL